MDKDCIGRGTQACDTPVFRHTELGGPVLSYSVEVIFARDNGYNVRVREI